MQAAADVDEAAAQVLLIPCARADDLLIVGALSVADREVFLGQNSQEQRAGRHLSQILDGYLAGSVIEVRKYVVADYQVGWLSRFVVDH